MTAGLLPAQRSPLRDGPITPLRMATILVVDPDRATRESAADQPRRDRRRPDPRGVLGRRRRRSRRAARSAAISPWSACSSGPTPAASCMPAGVGLAAGHRAGADRRHRPVIDAVGAGVSGVLIGRRANPAASSIPSTHPRPVEPGDRGHPTGRRRPVQQVDRRAAVAVGAHREEPSGPDRPQAGHRRPRPHGGAGDACRSHFLSNRAAPRWWRRRLRSSRRDRFRRCPTPVIDRSASPTSPRRTSDVPLAGHRRAGERRHLDRRPAERRPAAGAERPRRRPDRRPATNCASGPAGWPNPAGR